MFLVLKVQLLERTGQWRKCKDGENLLFLLLLCLFIVILTDVIPRTENLTRGINLTKEYTTTSVN